MADGFEERATALGHYIVENNATVRQAAKVFGISKSTVHKEIISRLKKANKALYQACRGVLEQNKAERHMRGGIATRSKYLEQKEQKG